VDVAVSSSSTYSCLHRRPLGWQSQHHLQLLHTFFFSLLSILFYVGSTSKNNRSEGKSPYQVLDWRKPHLPSGQVCFRAHPACPHTLLAEMSTKLQATAGEGKSNLILS